MPSLKNTDILLLYIKNSECVSEILKKSNMKNWIEQVVAMLRAHPNSFPLFKYFRTNEWLTKKKNQLFPLHSGKLIYFWGFWVQQIHYCIQWRSIYNAINLPNEFQKYCFINLQQYNNFSNGTDICIILTMQCFYTVICKRILASLEIHYVSNEKETQNYSRDYACLFQLEI